MAIKSNLIGGIDYLTPTARIKPTDLNDTNNAIINQSINLAQVPYTTLKSTGEWTNEGGLASDRFTSATGVNGTVNTTDTTALFVTNKYTNFNSTFSTSSRSTVDAFSGSFDSYTSNCVTSARGWISQVKTRWNSTSTSTVNIKIRNSASEDIADKDFTFSHGTGAMSHTFAFSDYTKILNSGETFSIIFTKVSGSAQLNTTNTLPTGTTLFECVSGLYTFNGGSGTIVFTESVYVSSGLVELETLNISSIDKAVKIYADFDKTADADLFIKISDGTLTTSEHMLTPRVPLIITLNEGMSGDMKITARLESDNISNKIELFGYGVSKQ